MNIRALEVYVEQRNSWERLFKQPSLSLLNAKDRQRIADMIDSDLSPENLCMDGEASPRYVHERRQFLLRCAEELQSIDPSVKFYEFG